MKRTLVVIGLAAAILLTGCAGPGGEGVNNTTNETDGALANDTGNDTFGDENDTEDDALGGDDNDTLGDENDTGNDTDLLGNDTNDTNASVTGVGA